MEHSQTTRWGTALIVLGGPCASVTTLVLCGYLAYKSTGAHFETGLSLWALLWAFIAGGALRQAIGSVIPRRGAVFIPGLKDDPNDALILVNVVRLAQAEVRPSLAVREGTVPCKGYNVWYRIVGDHDEPGRLPLLVLHGGPGLPHESVQPLEMLALAGRRVVFYDQLGCGNSDRPDDASLYSLDLFVEEIDSVRRALGLERIHLWGTGWGSVLALQYVLDGTTGVASLTLTSATARMPRSMQDLEPVYRLLPPRVGRVLRDWDEEQARADAEERMRAWRFVQTRYLCRLSPWPDYLMEALAKFGHRVNQTIVAPRALLPTGPLKDWNVEDRLGEIDVPTLVIKSRYDLALDAAKRVHQGITGSTLVTFRHSSSMPYIEEARRYRRVVGRFLDHIDKRPENHAVRDPEVEHSRP